MTGQDIYMYYKEKLASIIEKAIKNKNYELALQAISASAKLEYKYGINFIDNNLEDKVHELAERMIEETSYNAEDTVVFYDSFGEDTRGLAIIYLKALINLNVKLIYVTKLSSKNMQPTIDSVLLDRVFAKEYYDDTGSFVNRTKTIVSIFEKYRPKRAFYYALPHDSCGAVAFYSLKSCVRYQINLTDHAYWLGTKSLDTCIEFRQYGRYISNSFREIPLSKIKILPFYPFVNMDVSFEGFDFLNNQDKKIIFSGGALYKTLSKDNKYYRIIDYILSNHSDCVFIYAGSGDDSKLKKISDKYQNRVFHIHERKDLFQVLKHTYLYINTYPLLGGLMTQYALRADCIPVTLKSGDICSGFVLGEDRCDFFFDDESELCKYVSLLIDDKCFYESEKKKIQESFISENMFEKNLFTLMQFNCTDFINDNNCFEVYKNPICTIKDVKMYAIESIIAKGNTKLFFKFPVIFLEKIINSIIRH